MKKKLNKKQLRSSADRIWYEILMIKHPYCEACGAPAQQIHHFYYKGSYGHLRYNLDNGIGICMKCHFLLHHQDPKKVEERIKEKRGDKWFEDLKEKSRNRPTSFVSVKWFKDKIDSLNEYYINL